MASKEHGSKAGEKVKQRPPQPAAETAKSQVETVVAAEAYRQATATDPPPLTPQEVLALQRTVGNQVVQRVLAERVAEAGRPGQTGRPARKPYNTPEILRTVEYMEATGGEWTDPEVGRGVLPFTESGWDGQEIARRMSQIGSVSSPYDDVSCAQTTFLIALVLRGPGAVRDMIVNYLRRYRVGLRRPSTPQRIRRWYRRSIRALTPLLGKIDNQTLSYPDLSTILREMYTVYGRGQTGTGSGAHANMFRREGYTETPLWIENATQDQLMAQAQALRRGEVLQCLVHGSRRGTAQAQHSVQLGRMPDSDQLYFYDPWPIEGDQMILCDDNLNALDDYFYNPAEEEAEGGEAGEIPEEGEWEEFTGSTYRTFHIGMKFSPPGAEEEAEGE